MRCRAKRDGDADRGLLKNTVYLIGRSGFANLVCHRLDQGVQLFRDGSAELGLEQRLTDMAAEAADPGAWGALTRAALELDKRLTPTGCARVGRRKRAAINAGAAGHLAVARARAQLATALEVDA